MNSVKSIIRYLHRVDEINGKKRWRVRTEVRQVRWMENIKGIEPPPRVDRRPPPMEWAKGVGWQRVKGYAQIDNSLRAVWAWSFILNKAPVIWGADGVHYDYHNSLNLSAAAWLSVPGPPEAQLAASYIRRILGGPFLEEYLDPYSPIKVDLEDIGC